MYIQKYYKYYYIIYGVIINYSQQKLHDSLHLVQYR